MNVNNVKLETSLIRRNDQKTLYDPANRNNSTKTAASVLNIKDQFIPSRRNDSSKASLVSLNVFALPKPAETGAIGNNITGQLVANLGTVNPGQETKKGAMFQGIGKTTPAPQRIERNSGIAAKDLGLAAGGLDKAGNRAALPVPDPTEPPQKMAINQPSRSAGPLTNERPETVRKGGDKLINPAENTPEKTPGITKRDAARALDQTSADQTRNPMLDLLG